MFVSLQQLELRPLSFKVDIPVGTIDFDSKLKQSSPLHAEGTAQLLNETIGEIRIFGQAVVRIEGTCDRCVEPATYYIENNFDLVYLPAEQARVGGDEEVDEAAIEVGYYEGNGLELNDVLREVVLLALPMQLVCDDDCKGICPTCGQNRNQVDCGCQPKPADDRWSKLKMLRAELSSNN